MLIDIIKKNRQLRHQRYVYFCTQTEKGPGGGTQLEANEIK